MKTERDANARAQHADQTEYDRFKAGLRAALSVSKEELDKREAELQRERQAKKNKKPSK